MDMRVTLQGGVGHDAFRERGGMGGESGGGGGTEISLSLYIYISK